MAVRDDFPDEASYQRYLASGELPFSEYKGPGTRVGANVLAAVPNAFYGLGDLWDLYSTGVQYGARKGLSYIDPSFDRTWNQVYYGDEGAKEIEETAQRRYKEAMSELTPEQQDNPIVQDRVASAVSGSKEVYDLSKENAPFLSRMSEEARKAVSRATGLPEPRQQTSGDEAIQAVTTAIMPTQAVKTVATKGLARLGDVAEWFLPGSTGQTGNIIANTVADIGTGQIMRYVTDMPNVFQGDPTANPMEAMNLYTPDPDADPTAGLGGDVVSGAVSTFGAGLFGLAAIKGKVPKGKIKVDIDDVDTPEAAVRGEPKPEEIERTTTRGQRRYTTILNKAAPIRQHAKTALRNADEAETADTLSRLDRLSYEATPIEVRAGIDRTNRYGELPGGTKVVPPRVINDVLSRFVPEEIELFEKSMIAKTRLDFHVGEVRSLEQKVADLENDVRLGRRGRAEAAFERANLEKLVADPSIQEMRDLVAQFDANPKLRRVESMYRNVTDGILNDALEQKFITHAEVDALRKANPNFMLMRNDRTAGQSYFERLGGELGAERTEQSMYSRPRAVLTKNKNVENPIPPMDALQAHINDYIEFSRQNKARSLFSSIIDKSPDMGVATREAHHPVTVEEFNRPTAKLKHAIRKPNVYTYTKGGRVHIMETADPDLAKALRFNPGAATGWMNFARRTVQGGLTGMGNPAFAPKSAIYEMGPAFLTKDKSRSLGLIDYTVRRAVIGNDTLTKIVGAVNSKVFDPTMGVQALLNAGRTLSYTAIRNLGERIANDLTNRSGIYNIIANSIGGKEWMQKLGEGMVRTYNDSVVGLANREGIVGQYSHEPMLSTLADYHSATRMFTDNKALIQYKEILDAFRSMTKMSYFAQNLSLLQAKYKGKVPESEYNKLVYDTKTLSGDMTRSPGNERIAKTLSTIPYGQTSLNAMTHIGEMIAAKPIEFGMRFMGLVAASQALLMTMNDDVADWYWNKIPKWERMRNFPIVKPQYFISWTQGKKATPEDYNLVPMSPELIPLLNPIISGLRSMGVYGKKEQAHSTFMPDVWEAVKSIFPTGQNPLVEAYTAILNGDPYSEAKSLGLAATPEHQRKVTDVLNALFGSVVDIATLGGDAAVQELWSKEGGAYEAVSKAFGYGALAVERKLPEVWPVSGVGGLFTGGQRRLYATTQTRERVTHAMKIADELAKVRSNIKANAKAGGGLKLPVPRDPEILRMAEYINTELNRGAMEVLSKKRSNKNKEIVRVEENKDKMSPKSYHYVMNVLQRDMQTINEEQEEIIDRLNTSLTMQYGMDLDAAAKAIYNDSSTD